MAFSLPTDIQNRLDAAGAAVMVLTDDGRVRFWSAAAERVFGVPRSRAIGRPLEEVLKAQTSRGSGLERLTKRQHEILDLIAAGHSTREIARRIGRSTKTVEAHRAHIMKRLGVRNLAGLLRIALGREHAAD